MINICSAANTRAGVTSCIKRNWAKPKIWAETKMYICAPCICFTFLLFIAAPYTVCRGVELFIDLWLRQPHLGSFPASGDSDIPDLLIPCMAVLWHSPSTIKKGQRYRFGVGLWRGRYCHFGLTSPVCVALRVLNAAPRLSLSLHSPAHVHPGRSCGGRISSCILGSCEHRNGRLPSHLRSATCNRS